MACGTPLGVANAGRHGPLTVRAERPASGALGIQADAAAWSGLARQSGSGSAARSVFGGFA